jgi:hypothetical protein
MDTLVYYIDHKNYEDQDIEIQTTDLDTVDDPPGNSIRIDIQGADSPVILDTVDSDDDKTKPIRGRRLTASFNSDEKYNIDTFSDGGDGRFLVRLTTAGLSVPFIGNIVLDNNAESFQPRPNAVKLSSGEGLGALRDIELKTITGELPLGHFTIMEYLVMCLSVIIPNQEIHVIFNLYEEDTDPVTSHAFLDIYLDALTFEESINKRESCYTVLSKIMDAFGCFIAYDNNGWWIIRWDEYDAMGAGVTQHRTANFGPDGLMSGYTMTDLTKKIAADTMPEYQGYRMSQDTAIKKFQRRAGSVKHNYYFKVPIDVPCNGKFLRGDQISAQSGFRTYNLDDWIRAKDFPTSGAATANAYIRRNVDALSYETDRFAVLEPEPSTSEMYIESCGLGIHKKDKFNFSFNWAFSADAAGSGPYTRRVAIIRLEGDDATYWTLDEDGKWYQSNSTWTVNLKILQQTVELGDDLTKFQEFDIEPEEAPVTGTLYIMFLSESQNRYNVDVYINDLNFDYKPYISDGYFGISRPTRPFGTIFTNEKNGQQHSVSEDNGSTKTIEHEMFISDSPKQLFKGAMKKLSGTKYILTGKWNDYITPSFIGNDRMAKYIVFQWWNQYRKTRTVIEGDYQGINSALLGGTPGLIHRWKIYHGNQDAKYFMMTRCSIDFRTCGWSAIFVETSSSDGDRVVSADHEFKYIE